MTMRLDLSANPGADSIRDHIAELERELDAARARERRALVAGAEALRRIAAATPIGHEDVTKGPSTYNWLCYAASLLMAEASTTPATPLEQELITLRAREAKLREAAQYYMSQFGQALEAHGIPYEAAQSEADSALRAALAEGEDTPPVCDCNGGEQGDGLCALPHEPTCASLKREDTPHV